MIKRNTKVRALIVAVCAVAALVLVSCGDDGPVGSEALEFSDVWSREPAPGQTTSAVYGVVSNTGSKDVTITGASVAVTDRVELHETLMNDGVMSMREKEGGFVVPAGGSFTFEPGGPHVMLMGIDPDTYPDVVDVTFTFDLGEPTFVSADVRPLPGAMMNDGDMDHGDMDHGDMESDG